MSRYQVAVVVGLTLLAELLVIVGKQAYDTFTAQSVRPTVWYHGSATVEHDTTYGGMVEGADVYYGLICKGGYDTLVNSDEGDVYISGRADSIGCSYNYHELLGIAVMGYENTDERAGEHPSNAIVISQGVRFGEINPMDGGYGAAYQNIGENKIDYYVPAGSLSEAMPLAANIILRLNAATSTPLTIGQLKTILNASSPGEYVYEGKSYGKVINEELAIDYLQNGLPKPPPPEPCVDCAWLTGAVNYPLLLD